VILKEHKTKIGKGFTMVGDPYSFGVYFMSGEFYTFNDSINHISYHLCFLELKKTSAQIINNKFVLISFGKYIIHHRDIYDT